ncbi:MAG: hypothetical protein BGO40_01845 [Chryseobacterium sp. 39-10]|nr:MAG: hypothetical protein BGO40_01845 [Chryseobacterium sp. 39-10]
MNKRDFIKAIAGGNIREAQKIKAGFNSNENALNTITVFYPEPIPNEPTKEQQKAFEQFCRDAEKANPNKKIVFVTIADRKRPE